MTLRARAIHGVRWTILSRVIIFVAQYLVAVVLSRILAPGDFGLVAMVTALTAFAGVLLEFGIGGTLVQGRDLGDAEFESAFTFSAAAGLAATIVVAASAPLVSWFYGRPELESLTRLTSLGLLLTSLGTVPRARMQRRMAIKRLSLFDLVATAGGGLLAVALALAGAGTKTLVWSVLLSSALSSLLPLALGGWLPRRLRGFSAFRPMMGASLALLGFNVLNYWARNLDNVLVGRFLGQVELGLYVRAYSLMLLPISLVIGFLGATLLPALSEVQDDRPRAKAIFLRTVGAIAFVSFPMMLGLAAVARPFILAVYGPKWLGCVPLLVWLAPVGALQAILNPTGWVYISQGRTDLLLRWGLFGTTVIMAFLSAGVAAGSATSVAMAYFAANALLFAPGLVYPAHLVGFSARDVARVLIPPAVLAGAMFGVVRLVDAALPGSLSQWTVLTIEVASGSTVYLASSLLLRFDSIRDIRSLLNLQGEARST